MTALFSAGLTHDARMSEEVGQWWERLVSLGIGQAKVDFRLELTFDGEPLVKQISLSLQLTSRQVEEYYRGRAQHVVAEAADGRIIQLPIKVLHPFISKQGIQGDFLVTTDDENRFVKIAPLKRDDSQGSLLDAMG